MNESLVPETLADISVGHYVRLLEFNQRELREKLAALEREAQPRTTTISSVPLDPGHGWPAGVTLDAPGALTIRFTSPEDLLGAVLALAEDAAGNYESFQARLAQKAAQGREEAAP